MRFPKFPKWLKFPVSLMLCVSLSAEDLYFKSIATGNGDFSSAANAGSRSDFNSAPNWGSGAGKISAGDTVHLVGSFTNSLSMQGGGSAGSPVTVIWESGAKMTGSANTYGNGNPMFTTSGNDWVVLDGSNSVNQVTHELTDNGTALTYQFDVTAISASGSENIVIRNFAITNIYQRTSGSTTDGTRNGSGIIASGNNVTITNNYASDGDGGIGFLYHTGTTTNLLIGWNTLLKLDHSITIGNGDEVNCILEYVTVAYNRMNNMHVWDGNGNIHLDGLIQFNEDSTHSGHLAHERIYGNVVGPNVGVVSTTAAMFFNYFNPNCSELQDCLIYNNVFLEDAPWNWSNGQISFVPYGPTNSAVYNNTIIGHGSTGTGITVNSGNLKITNNLFYATGYAINLIGGSSQPVGLKSDNNIFYNVLGFALWSPLGICTFSQWKSLGGYDTALSVTNQPSLDANYVPTVGDTVAKGHGIDLATLAGFSIDAAGVARPSGNWDIGAYQYNAGGDTTAPTLTITSPTSATTYDNGSSFSISMAGTASDNVSVSSVAWVNDRGGSGSATGTTSWSFTATGLSSGVNNITVTATDTSSNTGNDALAVTVTPTSGTPSRRVLVIINPL